MSKKSSTRSSVSFLEAIALSLNEDYDIKAVVNKSERGTPCPPGLVLAEDWVEVLVQISDHTALGVTLEDDGCTLNLYKFSFGAEDDMMRFVQSTGFNRTVYWEHKYDLANPHDFARVLHLIGKNVDENKNWPHSTKKR